MIGTWINIIAILVGGTLGSFLGNRIPERFRVIVIQGVGLVVLAVGINMALQSENVLILLASILFGGLLGEWWQINRRLDNLGGWLEQSLQRFPFLSQGRFIEGFVTATVVFCVGPMAILGAIQDGLTGDVTLLGIKSVLDGFSALVFSSALGMGVSFSAIPVLLVQGSFSLGASVFDSILSEAMLAELTGAGGVLMMGISLVMLEIRQLRVANFLPALLLAPILVALAAWIGFP